MTEEKIEVPQTVYFKESEMRVIAKAADMEERSVSNWIRKVVLGVLCEWEEGEEFQRK